MKAFVWIVLILILFSSISGCSPRARAERIGDDIEWILLDGEPDKDK